jgi:hypothetical protein
MTTRLFLFPGAVRRNQAVDLWFDAHPGPLGDIARRWFEVMRQCGDDVRDLLHDGAPTACVDEAAFGYVDAFTGHVNVGFFQGADLEDPAHLLEGTGKYMRHVKLRPGDEADASALRILIEAAYGDMQGRLARRAAGAT